MDQPPQHAPSPPHSPNLPPVPTVTGVQPVRPPTQLTIRPQASFNQAQMPQAPHPVQLAIGGSPATTGPVNPPFTQMPIPTMLNGQQVPQQAIQTQKLRIDTYTDKSIIVRGDTKTYSTTLKMMGGGWVKRPKYGGSQEPGWCFGNYKRQEVEKYVAEVNAGTAAPPPTFQVQTVSWNVFKPETGMRLKIKMPHGIADYSVADVEKQGWTVVKATIFAPQNPDSVHQMAIISGQWQILGYLDSHSIEPAS